MKEFGGPFLRIVFTCFQTVRSLGKKILKKVSSQMFNTVLNTLLVCAKTNLGARTKLIL